MSFTDHLAALREAAAEGRRIVEAFDEPELHEIRMTWDNPMTVRVTDVRKEMNGSGVPFWVVRAGLCRFLTGCTVKGDLMASLCSQAMAGKREARIGFIGNPYEDARLTGVSLPQED